MRFHVVTLFPEVIDAYGNASILGRAQREKKLTIDSYQLRDYVRNKWGKADERPYGGGPGMVLQAEPFVRAVETIEKKLAKGSKGEDYDTMIYHNIAARVQKTNATNPNAKTKTKKAVTGGARQKRVKVLITSAGGKPLTNAMAKKLAKEQDVIILCGRYEGIDARVKRVLKAQEVSVGPYILTGGEVPALAIIDATARQIPGVLGKIESLEEGRVASHDVYTRPEVLEHQGKKYRVPKVLLSGHHANIDTQRSKKRSNPNQSSWK